MAVSIREKLQNKLPINFPQKSANGQQIYGIVSSVDPYLNGNAAWNAGVKPVVLKGPGAYLGVNELRGPYFIHQQMNDGMRGYPTTGYIEITDGSSPILVTDFATRELLITQPGNYIFDFDRWEANFGLAWPSTFCRDYIFASIERGLLKAYADNIIGWVQSSLGGSSTYKGSDNLIHIDCSVANSGITWGWSTAAGSLSGTRVQYLINVHYIPPGATLLLKDGTGATVLTINQAGEYVTDVTLGATVSRPTISVGVTTIGEAIISKFAPKLYNDAFSNVQGSLWCQVSALFIAQSRYFDRILNPQTIHMATSFDRPNMQGWNPLAGEPILGYGQAPPPSGYFRVGDTIRNNCAIAGSVSGWRCTVSGNPGTWMPLATL